MNPSQAFYEALRIGPSKECEEIITDTNKVEEIYTYKTRIQEEGHNRGVHVFETSLVNPSSYFSCRYATEVLKGPFPDGEEEISKDGSHACEYAIKALNGPFPRGEQSISNSSYESYRYSEEALKAPFPLGEKSIARSSWHSYHYARIILKGPFQLGEESILRSEPESLDYQFRFNRNICSEHELCKYPLYALSYAIMIGGRFPEGEPSMKRSPRIWKRYQEFLNGPQQSIRFSEL